MMNDTLNTTLQQNIITLLCHDDVNGKVVANLVAPELFEGDYRTIAEKAVAYWTQYKEAPKKAHTGDLVSDILQDPHNRKAQTYRRILIDMLQLSESINAEYVLGQLRNFIRAQKLKAMILRSAEQIAAPHPSENAMDRIEEAFTDLLKVHQTTFDAGRRYEDIDALLEYQAKRQQADFTTGI